MARWLHGKMFALVFCVFGSGRVCGWVKFVSVAFRVGYDLTIGSGRVGASLLWLSLWIFVERFASVVLQRDYPFFSSWTGAGLVENVDFNPIIIHISRDSGIARHQNRTHL
jgi:hypothetical protein